MAHGHKIPDSPDFEIRYLAYQLEEPVTDLLGTREVQDSFPSDEIQVYLFKRTDEGFKYWGERSYNPPPVILDQSTDATDGGR